MIDDEERHYRQLALSAGATNPNGDCTVRAGWLAQLVRERDAAESRAEQAERDGQAFFRAGNAVGLELEAVQKQLAASEQKRQELERAVPDDLRALGWMVAVHNDYTLDGHKCTFWLLTNGDRCIRGEGLTDAVALDEIRAALSPPPQSDRAEASGARCHCATGGPGSYDGPQRDCPVHGDSSGASGAVCRCCLNAGGTVSRPCPMCGRPERCSTCNGFGDRRHEECSDCNGTGRSSQSGEGRT